MYYIHVLMYACIVNYPWFDNCMINNTDRKNHAGNKWYYQCISVEPHIEIDMEECLV